jgi:hypothetical protein
VEEASERLRTALFKGALAELTRDARVCKAFEDQLIGAWAAWALVRIGPKSMDYGKAAFEMYLLMAACLIVEKGWTTEKVANKMPYLIPQRLPRKGLSPFELIVKRDIFRISDEYKELLEKLTTIQRKKWRNPIAHVLALKENLPGIADGLLRKWTNNKASDIAANFLGRKYSVGAETLKKWVQKTNLPRLMKWLDEQVARSCQAHNIDLQMLFANKTTARPQKK